MTAPRTYVADRGDVIHIESELLQLEGDDRYSVTECGRRLNFDEGEAVVRIFSLSYRHLSVDGCLECSAATVGEGR